VGKFGKGLVFHCVTYHCLPLFQASRHVQLVYSLYRFGVKFFVNLLYETLRRSYLKHVFLSGVA